MNNEVNSLPHNKILLVEDDTFIRDIYQSELTRNGFEVTAFASGEEALQILEQKQFDLLLLDIMLPGINGIDVLKKIKANPKTQYLQVVILTNLGQETVVKEGLDTGAVGYLIKASYNPDQIVQEVKKILSDSNSSASA